MIAYRIGIRPTVDYKPATRPRLTPISIVGGGESHGRLRGDGLSQQPGRAATREHAIAVGLKTGLAIGVVTAIVGSCTPFVEWIADHVPEKRMGVFGVGLILIGFTLQSAQYWLVLLDVNLR